MRQNDASMAPPIEAIHEDCFDASTAPSVEAAQQRHRNDASTGWALEASSVRQRHWKNDGQPGDFVFVTTSTLDFAQIFKVEALADRMVDLLFEAHLRYRAALHAFVVMPDHLHWISQLPDDSPVSDFVRKVKSFSAHDLHPLIQDWQERHFDEQRGLNGRFFWGRSFRSFVITREQVLGQKAGYIHANPVRRGLCECPLEYRWSSAGFFERGLYHPEVGLSREVASTDGAVEASAL